jgi:MFS family permease
VPILLAPILGPVIAGAILHYASWRWLFLVNLPVGALAFALALRLLPPDRDQTQSQVFDWAGLALLSPGLVLFLYAMDHMGERAGLAALAAAAMMLGMFIRSATRKGDRALLDLRLFKGRTFATAAAAQFLSNGVSFSGQMLIPIFLIRVCGRTAAEMGWLMAPLGLGMLCTYPSMGALTRHFGIRRLSAGGALLALVGTLPFVYLASHGLNRIVLVAALLLRGGGQGAIGLPSLSAAYAAVPRQDLPMATTTLNVVQRLGGPTLTTLCATFLGWRLSLLPAGSASSSGPFAAAFLLLCALHALALAAALRLPP